MSKAKGTRNEHKAMRALEVTGYHTTRAAGSLGMFDVIAINAQGLRLIQVKTNRDASPVEREQIALFDRLPPNATKEIWIYKDYAREPLIKIISSREG
jgi:Holliday junction resolvase